MLPDVNRFRMFPETLVAYQDNAMVIAGIHGHVEHGLQGFYRHQTRFLSVLGFTLNGWRPRFISANSVDTYSQIAYYLCPTPAGGLAGPEPDDPNDDGGEIAEKALEIQINRFVGGGMHQDVILTNHAMAPAEVELVWTIEADFNDLTAAQDGRIEPGGPVDRHWLSTEEYGELTLVYRHPELPHATRVRFPRGQGELRYENERVVMRLQLLPRQPVRICADVIPVFCGEPAPPAYGCGSFRSHDTPRDRARDAWVDSLARLETPNGIVQDAWDRSLADLGSLALGIGTGSEVYTPAAGIPIYQALFGRDTLTASWQSGFVSPLMLEGTILTIARYLGRRVDDRFDEQPGRVVHQHQLNPLSLLQRNPFYRYYGDYAGPGLFLVAIAWHFAITGDKAFARRLREPILRVLEWMDRDGDRDGDGFYEYAPRSAWGTKNQGWKDSEQAIIHANGRLVKDPIAVVEVQGYYYAAKQLMGLLFLALGESSRGTQLLWQAAALKKRFNKRFWMPDEGFYALALDPDKRQVKSIASNAGHCLACGIIDRDKAAAVAHRLMAPDMFSGWGIRTLSSEHPAYNPFAYHLGTVWPPENGSIALGFTRYGLYDLTGDLARGLLDATLLFDLHRLPEAFGGHARDHEHPHPGIYPQANAPQAWSASAVVMLVQAMLGLLPLAPWRTLLLDPHLPDWLPELTLSEVPVGDRRVSLQFKRDGSGHTDYRVLAGGGVRVLRQPPPDDLEAGLAARVGALVGWPF